MVGKFVVVVFEISETVDKDFVVEGSAIEGKSCAEGLGLLGLGSAEPVSNDIQWSEFISSTLVFSSKFSLVLLFSFMITEFSDNVAITFELFSEVCRELPDEMYLGFSSTCTEFSDKVFKILGLEFAFDTNLRRVWWQEEA